MLEVSPDLARLHLRSILCLMKIHELKSNHSSYVMEAFKTESSFLTKIYFFKYSFQSIYSPSFNIIYDKYFLYMVSSNTLHPCFQNYC